MAFGSAFQGNAFQNDAFERFNITSTNVIQMPVDCVMAGDQKEYQKRRMRGLPIRAGRLSKAAMRHALGE